jgi:hypothetical protein
MVQAFLYAARWLHNSPLGWAAAGGWPWLWAACESVHFMGMALLIGAVGLLDARMLGLFKGLPIAPLERLVPWGVLGFVINLSTGLVFFAGAPEQYVENIAFWLKMLFVLLAGVNVSLFYFTGLSRRVDRLGAGEDAPMAAKLIAGVSLFLWFGVLYWGRMLPFIGNAF